MIKMKLDRPQGPLVIFGLSDMNLKKLKQGMPISINMADIGMTGELIIFHGSTEAAMVADLEKNGFLPASAAGGVPS